MDYQGKGLSNWCKSDRNEIILICTDFSRANDKRSAIANISHVAKIIYSFRNID
ncbi:hypothetical protein H6F77_02340 [Microcoleus sp. FACHB-831]|uniref:hypothetical protein n=1 Tax=Microcoleus sp. FACHB-831 TaxID=2692827 RepID=UPI0016869F24|nr:hypothetical protein [Microcoleus sp. FACHB-831]MBD1919955.1 hypothetical protein [Microcoleus sp. FACHB-831]